MLLSLFYSSVYLIHFLYLFLMQVFRILMWQPAKGYLLETEWLYHNSCWMLQRSHQGTINVGPPPVRRTSKPSINNPSKLSPLEKNEWLEIASHCSEVFPNYQKVFYPVWKEFFMKSPAEPRGKTKTPFNSWKMYTRIKLTSSIPYTVPVPGWPRGVAKDCCRCRNNRISFRFQRNVHWESTVDRLIMWDSGCAISWMLHNTKFHKHLQSKILLCLLQKWLLASASGPVLTH